MKKLLTITSMLVLILMVGCGNTITKEKENEFLTYLSGDSKQSYLLTADAKIDLTDVSIQSEKTIMLAKGITLEFVGTYSPENGKVTIMAEQDGTKDATVDLSLLQYNITDENVERLFEIRYDVNLIEPAEQDDIFVETSEQWASVKRKIVNSELPPPEHEDNVPMYENGVNTPEEFLDALQMEDLEQIELCNSMTVELRDMKLTRNVVISCNNNSLTLFGEIDLQGGYLEIRDKGENKESKIDLSGLTVLCDTSLYPENPRDIIFIGMGFRQIAGEPILPESMLFEIPDSGVHASIKLREITTPEQHEAKLQEDMTDYLSGNEEDHPGGVGIRTGFLADGILEIYLDNPTIDHYIGLEMDPGTTIIITGSVTFDGGTYAIGTYSDTGITDKATVDITGLIINGNKELGHEKTPDLFSISGDLIDFKFNTKAPHITTVQNDRFWLRWDE